MPAPILDTCALLGVNVSAINMSQALDALGSWVDDGHGRTTADDRPSRYVCVTPAHSLMDCHDDPALTQIFNEASMVTPDGMAVVWLLKAHGYRHVTRVYGPDLMEAAIATGVDRGWSHYFLGGTVEGLERLERRLLEQHPSLRVAGSSSPPFRALSPTENAALVDEINLSGADFLWVGLGSPKQERWMAEHAPALRVAATLGVGAAFDFLSGEKPQAPSIMQRSGTEWLFRLASEPKRLWPRYRRYPHFVWLALAGLRAARR